ncbi:hypothetical protein CI105_02485 [Candidatus Izimaplasma bacterium ZiA1]|uniref:pyridoxal phosphate-dependent aminotransferase n=1 Tax=Candidatus Izimoplasma sp. ZiA1 TaxID=2024899 RepID=UPI000BAA6C4C|nr:hypothetical protein CI105_02485 [Candidatus Izimaplasma bacterium ZiA1]
MEYRNHGANPTKLYKSNGIALPKRIIDFSTNTNVIKKRFILNINKYISKYPDDENIKIKNLLKTKHNINMNQIIVGNGVNEILYLLINHYHDKTFGIIDPDYSEYQIALKNLNVKHKIFNSIKEVKNIDILIFSNPNNPTGSYIENYKDLSHIKDVLFVIDESYIDFTFKDRPKSYKNMIILKSLTKIYNLAGIRIGYAYGDEEIINSLNQQKPTWSVNSLAEHLACKYLKDKKFLKKTESHYKKEKKYIEHMLNINNIKYKNSFCNFYLIPTKDDLSLMKYLLIKGLVVRHTRNYLNLNGKYIRVSVKKHKENKQLIKGLKEFKDENLFI